MAIQIFPEVVKVSEKKDKWHIRMTNPTRHREERKAYDEGFKYAVCRDGRSYKFAKTIQEARILQAEIEERAHE